MTHLPRLLKDNGWDYVGVSTGAKGKHILKENPFIDRLHFFELGGKDVSLRYYHTRLALISEQYDKVIELSQSLEVYALSLEYQTNYFQHQKTRERHGKDNYYDIMTEAAGYPELCGKYKGELFFSDEETKTVEHDLLREGRFKDKFKIMMNLAGSGPHKCLIQVDEIVQKLNKEFKDTVIFTTAGERFKPLDVDYPNIKSLVGKKQFRQVLNMTKYMDCVIGCESGLMCGASLFDVPTIQLMTAASIYNHCKYAKNDYSLQSPARCSPCYKGPYKYYGCPKKNNLPLCVYFDTDKIVEQVRKIYSLWKK